MIRFTYLLVSLMACSSCSETPLEVAGHPVELTNETFEEITEMATGLTTPWGLTILPDGSALISSRTTAQIHRVPSSGGTPELVGIVPDVSFSAEGGLLGLETSPTFESDSSIYAYVSFSPSNRVVKIRISNNFCSLEVTDTVLQGIVSRDRHHGGRVKIGPDGNLWISTGDAFQGDLAQDLNSLSGKILRIGLDGSIPEGNMNGSPIYSYGHRNVQGLAFGPDGLLYASEFGHRAWDELNLIQRGKNYGWPQTEGINGNTGERPLEVFRTNECSPSGMAYASGSLWMAGLHGQRLYQIPVDNGSISGPIVSHLFQQYGRIRSVEVAQDGALWIITSNTDGTSAAFGGVSPGIDDDKLIRIVIR